MGAIALVLIVVVFLPMVLDNEPKPLSQDVEIKIPPIPPETTVSSLPAPRTEPEAAAPPVVEPAPATAPPAEPSVQSAPAPAAPQATMPQADAETYVVQLGAFSNAGNAKQLAAKVRSSRFKAYTEVVNTANGDRTRVRVGPYPSREAAEKARTRLKALKLTMGEPSILRADE
ncbi:MAG: SPOR domain-containing protein [Burkholderiales bacterium]